MLLERLVRFFAFSLVLSILTITSFVRQALDTLLTHSRAGKRVSLRKPLALSSQQRGSFVSLPSCECGSLYSVNLCVPCSLRFVSNSSQIMQVRYPLEWKEAHATMHRIGMELIEEKRVEILAEQTTAAGSSSVTDGRDILSVLSKRRVYRTCRVKLIGYFLPVRSNLSSDPTQRLSTSETLSQISTFIAAGACVVTTLLCQCLAYAIIAQDTRPQLRHSLGVSTPLRVHLGSSKSFVPSFGLTCHHLWHLLLYLHLQ